MILDYFGDLNWAAIIVASVAWYAFSAIWYSLPPLSQAWQQASKAEMNTGTPMVMLLVPTFIGYVVTTIVIALLVKAIGITGASDGIALGVVLGLGFGTVGALVTQLYESKGSTYWLINGVNSIIAFVIVGAILGAWA